MGASDLAVDVLLGLGVAGELLCVAGVLVMRTTFDRLHYAEHVTVGGLEAIAAVGLLFLLNPAVVLATAMATRRIDEGEKT